MVRASPSVYTGMFEVNHGGSNPANQFKEDYMSGFYIEYDELDKLDGMIRILLRETGRSYAEVEEQYYQEQSIQSMNEHQE